MIKGNFDGGLYTSCYVIIFNHVDNNNNNNNKNNNIIYTIFDVEEIFY